MNNKNSIDETHANDSTDDLNLGRRRLIRGAAYAAPMVLTLRSGALAAATSSCTGPVAEVITSTNGNSMLAATTNVSVGEPCISNAFLGSCGDRLVSGTVTGVNVTTDSNGKLYCLGLKNQQNVAIISSLAGTSVI